MPAPSSRSAAGNTCSVMPVADSIASCARSQFLRQPLLPQHADIPRMRITMIPHQMPLPDNPRRKLRMRLHPLPDTKKSRRNFLAIQQAPAIAASLAGSGPSSNVSATRFPPTGPLQIAGKKNCHRINPIPPTKIGTYTPQTPATAQVHLGIGSAMNSTDAIPIAAQVTTP